MSGETGDNSGRPPEMGLDADTDNDTGRPSAAQLAVGAIAPKLAQLTDDVLYGDVWARPGLGPRDRSLITVAALVAMGRSAQLGFHLDLAINNGVTPDEVEELMTHLAFYAGWPAAMSAIEEARDVLTRPSSHDRPRTQPTPPNTEVNHP